jgi:hypothetical protein
VFPGIRKWLPADHPWRKCIDLFYGSEELETSLPIYNGEDMNDVLEEWEACPTPGKKRPRVKPLRGVWKARSIFWDLPYWKYLHTPHSLDLMHITKNVCESLVATIINMSEKTKDGPEARNDLIKLGIRKELHGGRPDDADDDETQVDTQGHMHKKAKRNDYYCPPSCFTLSEPKLHQFFSVLLGVKLPTGYGGKIS